MGSQRLDFRPASCDIYARPGSDLTFTVAVSGTGYSSAPTVTCDIGGQTPTTSVSLTAGVVLVTVTLSDTQTTTLGTTGSTWSMLFTSGSTTTPILTGSYVGGTSGNTSQGMQVGVAMQTGAVSVQVLTAGGSSGGGGGASALDDLSDVTITAAASGDILRHNGTAWVDAVGTTHFEAAGAVATHSADTTAVHGITDTDALATIAKQDTKPATDGTVDLWWETDAASFYVYDPGATDFVEVAGGASNLDGLSDVTITAAASGDILRHNGTAWVDAVGTTHFDAAGTAASAVAAHEADTTSVHGIADTSTLYRSGGTDVAVADGGTGASDAATARTNLGVDYTTLDERTRDTIGTALVAGSNITITPNDGADTITIAASGSSASRTTFSNANYTVLSSDRLVAQTGTMSAARTLTMPAANAVSAGTVISIIDESGTVTGTNALIIARAGADTINGATSITVGAAYCAVDLVSDGTSKWTSAGNLVAPNGRITSSSATLIIDASGGGSENDFAIDAGSTHIAMATNFALAWKTIGVSGADLTLSRAAAKILQIGDANGANSNGWLNYIGLKRVSTQFDATSSTTLANITGLSVNVIAARTYSFSADLFTSSDVAAGVKVAIGGTATATAIRYETVITDAAAIAAQTRSTALGSSAGVTAVTAALVRITGTITVNAAGTLTVQFAQNASNAAASSVLVGSWLRIDDNV